MSDFNSYRQHAAGHSSHHRNASLPPQKYDDTSRSRWDPRPPYHTRNPSAPAVSYQRQYPPHDSGYDGPSDTIYEDPYAPPDRHLSQASTLRSSDQSLPQNQHARDTPATSFDDIPETFDKLDISPHSSTSGHSKSFSVGRYFTPRLRHSKSFAAGYRPQLQMDPIPNGGIRMPMVQRLSDDGSNSLQQNSSKSHKKRSGLSGILSNVLGSPRGKPEISAPSNPTHLCHVGFDNTTGEYSVRLILLFLLLLPTSHRSPAHFTRPRR